MLHMLAALALVSAGTCVPDRCDLPARVAGEVQFCWWPASSAGSFGGHPLRPAMVAFNAALLVIAGFEGALLVGGYATYIIMPFAAETIPLGRV